MTVRAVARARSVGSGGTVGAVLDPDLSTNTEFRERGGQDLVAQVRRTGEAAPLGLVPAVAARVLTAGHAEVEGLVECVQLLGRLLAIGLAAGRGHRFVQRRVVGHDEVLQAARQDPDALELRGPGRGRLERVARSAPFAEGFGQDLGHRAPGEDGLDASGTTNHRPEWMREYTAGASTPLRRGYLRTARMVRSTGVDAALW